MDRRPLAVFDIDGVLADVRHRLPLIERRPPDWDGFFDAAGLDPVWPQGAALAAESALDCEVVYLSGRPERCRDDTLAWLARAGLPGGDLHLRGPDDRRPARAVKPPLLRRLARDRVVAVVVDDDARVCEAYERAGFPVLRAGWAADAPALGLAQDTDGRT